MPVESRSPFRFGAFEVDPSAGEIRKNGVQVRLPPQPFRLLVLLASQSGRVVTRDEIRRALWGDDTFVDFEQGVNFSVKQIREALGDAADQPRYVQTVPRRGYRFIATTEPIGAAASAGNVATRFRRALTDVSLHKALWANIAEMKIAERRRQRLLIAIIVLLTAAVVLLVATRWSS
jgi:DNA-binding winged helix-turn-helix (wHTH) protein